MKSILEKYVLFDFYLLSNRSQKLGIILEKKMFQKLELSKKINTGSSKPLKFKHIEED